MTETRQRHGLTRWVHFVLTLGISISALVMLVGIVLSLATGQYASEGPPPPWAQLIGGVMRGDAVALLQAGLVLLMLTPIARVLVLGLGWLVDKEYRFATIALIVFALLIGSLILGSA